MVVSSSLFLQCSQESLLCSVRILSFSLVPSKKISENVYSLISATGLSLSRDVASSFIDDNVGLTVGHTVFSLTIQWGACVVFSITGPRSDQAVRRTTSVGFP